MTLDHRFKKRNHAFLAEKEGIKNNFEGE